MESPLIRSLDRCYSCRSVAAGVTKATLAPITLFKSLDHFKTGLHYGHEDHLRDTLTYLDSKIFVAAVPARDKDLPLVIRIDKTHKITKNNPFLMPKSRAR